MEEKNKGYYWVATFEEKKKLDVCEEYDLLLGEDGFECRAGEPEDRTFYRDLRGIVTRLNQQHQQILTLEEKLRKYEEAFKV